MRVSFRTKLLASHVGLVVAVVIIVVAELSLTLGADLERQLDARLERQAAGAAQWIGPARQHPGRLAARLSLVVHAGVAILDKDGKLLANSEDQMLVDDDPDAFADLPEVVDARAGRVGHATRIDEALRDQVLYVAVPAEEGLVVRVAAPLSEIHETQRAMRSRLSFALLVGVLTAALLGALAARNAARPLRAMTGAASDMATGSFDVRVAANTPDEFGQLGASLNSLASQLGARIGDLTTERDRLSAILAGMDEGVLVLDHDDRVVVANPSASKLLARGDALVGRSLEDAMPHASMRALVAEAKRGGDGALADVDDRERTGKEFSVYARALAPGAGGGVVAVIRDLTEIRALETMRRDFIANASHELKTPVTAIQGYAETLLEGNADSATQRRFLAIVHRHAKRLGALLEALLRLSELEARGGADGAVREPVDVGKIAAQIAEAVRARRGATATVKIEFDDETMALGDPLGIEQVFENLIDNAVKYGKEGGTVEVKGARANGKVVMTIADDGPGVDKQHLPRLFERFYRVDPGRSREKGGSGLGLSIVKQLVTSMGGSVRVESEIGNGCRFTIELPSA